jgi:oligoribonuclease
VAGPDALLWLDLIADTDRLIGIAMILTDGQLAELAALEPTANEADVLAFINAHVPAKVQPVLAGSTLHRDRRAIRKFMPKLDERLHYRMVDVGTIAELAKRWFPRVVSDLPSRPPPTTALVELRAAIAELKFYRERIFVPGTMEPKP